MTTLINDISLPISELRTISTVRIAPVPTNCRMCPNIGWRLPATLWCPAQSLLGRKRATGPSQHGVLPSPRRLWLRMVVPNDGLLRLGNSSHLPPTPAAAGSLRRRNLPVAAKAPAGTVWQEDFRNLARA